MKNFHNGHYRFSISKQGFAFYLSEGNQLFLESRLRRLCFILKLLIVRWFRNISWQCIEINQSGSQSWLVQARMTGNIHVHVRNQFYFLDDRLICNADYCSDRKHNLNGWHVAPEGSQLNCERIHTLSGQHGTDSAAGMA